MSAPILVTGSTGTTGTIVTRLLREAGADVRPTSRTPDEEQVRFDWMDDRTWPAALEGVERMYLIGPIGVADPAPLVRPFLERGLDSGLRRVVLLSSSAVTSSDPRLGALHRLVSELMPEWAVLRPSWFMQNFTGSLGPAQGLRNGRVITATGSGRVAFIDAADIAAVAVRSLLDDVPPDTDLILTGPAAVSFAQVCAVATELTGRTIDLIDADEAEFARHLVQQGVPVEFAALLAGMDSSIRRGSEDRVTDTVERVTGRKPASINTFLTANADLLTGS